MKSLWNGQLGNHVCHFQEKVSRLDRIVAEHNQFSLGIKELQDWMTDTIHVLESYCHPTSDKSVLDSRMLKLEVCLFRDISLIHRVMFSSSLHLRCVVYVNRFPQEIAESCVCMGWACLSIAESCGACSHVHALQNCK